MADADAPEPLVAREPTVEDLRDLCRALNERRAKYVVVGGFAMRAANYVRGTIDIDLIVASDPENERRVFDAVGTLPDHAARELAVGELARYTVIRVADEIVVDLMRSAGGIDYERAAKHVVVRSVDGVSIPFASPALLYRMKSVTGRDKDAGDLAFLRQWFADRGEPLPSLDD